MFKTKFSICQNSIFFDENFQIIFYQFQPKNQILSNILKLKITIKEEKKLNKFIDAEFTFTF